MFASRIHMMYFGECKHKYVYKKTPQDTFNTRFKSIWTMPRIHFGKVILLNLDIFYPPTTYSLPSALFCQLRTSLKNSPMYVLKFNSSSVQRRGMSAVWTYVTCRCIYRPHNTSTEILTLLTLQSTGDKLSVAITAWDKKKKKHVKSKTMFWWDVLALWHF